MERVNKEICPSLHPHHCRHHPGVRSVPASTGGGGGREKSQAVAVGRQEVPAVLRLSRWLPIQEATPKLGTAWTVLTAINGQEER